MEKLDKISFRNFSERSNVIGLVHIAIHLSSLVFILFLFDYSFINSNYSLLLFSLIFYGFIVNFLGWTGAGHEMAHKTAFSNQKLNEFFLDICCILTWSNKVHFRKTHMAHHQNTFVGGIDFEVEWDASKSVNPNLSLILFDYIKCYRTLKNFILNSVNYMPANKLDSSKIILDDLFKKQLFQFARKVLIFQILLVIALFLSGLPHLLVPLIFGSFIFTYPSRLLALAQHHGKEQAEKDTIKNSRTVILNRIISFFYWNMNFHVEHHLYPNIPYHKLPKLRKNLFGVNNEKAFSLFNVYQLIKSDQKKLLSKSQ